MRRHRPPTERQNLEGGTAKIEIISQSVPPAQPDTLAPSLQQYTCGRERKAGKVSANCQDLAKGLKLAASQRAKAKLEFTLKNDTSCQICFSYDRCNGYGCWDQAVRLSGGSTLLAGVSERAPAIKHPQFCAGEPEVKFMAAKEKAKREGVHALTSEDIRGLGLDQIRELRGY